MEGTFAGSLGMFGLVFLLFLSTAGFACGEGGKLVGRVEALEHELEVDLHTSNSTLSSPPSANFTADTAPVGLPSKDPASTRPSRSSDVITSSDSLDRNTENSSSFSSRDSTTLESPPSGTLLSSSEVSPPPFLAARRWRSLPPRPPGDPRTVVGSPEFFRTVQTMHREGRPLDSKFASAVLNVTALPRNISRDQLGPAVHLIHLFLNCSPRECPDFGPPCGQLHNSYSVCRSAAFHSMPESDPSPRSLCTLALAPAPGPGPLPATAAREKQRKKWVDPKPPKTGNSACLHKPDGWWSDGIPTNVFQLRDVYIETAGVTFDNKVVIDRSGCIRDAEDLFYKAGDTQVYHVEKALSLFYSHAINFFHSLVEALPLFITIAPFLQARPDLPIIMKCAQWLNYLQMGELVVGIPVADMNIVCIEQKDLLRVQELIQPMFPPCGYASPELYFELRRRFYLVEDGLPFYKPGWVLRGQKPLTFTEMARIHEDWVAILAHRPGSDRSLNIETQIQKAMIKEFGAERFIIFNGSMGVLHAKELFNRAALYVGVHGAALSNIVFMPLQSFVWEFRPLEYKNGCYQGLAQSCGVRYYATWGAGSKETTLVVNVTVAMEDFTNIVKDMREAGIR